MTDFTKILDKAKELEAKMKESQEKIKEIRAEGVSGSNSVKITLDGEGEMQNIKLSDDIMKEDKTIIEDLIVAAHNSAKSNLKSKTTEEISILFLSNFTRFTFFSNSYFNLISFLEVQILRRSSNELIKFLSIAFISCLTSGFCFSS